MTPHPARVRQCRTHINQGATRDYLIALGYTDKEIEKAME